MQNLKDAVSKLITNLNVDENLKKEYLELLKNVEFKNLVNSLNYSDEELLPYVYKLKKVVQETENCKNCIGRTTCTNELNGYKSIVDENLNFSYGTCSFTNAYLKDTEYLKYVEMFDLPKQIKEAKMSNIFTNDNKRLPVIKYISDYLKDATNNKILGKGLYLNGSFGSGKTYLVAALFNELAKNKISSVIVYYPELLRNLKSSFGNDFNERFEFIKKSPLLLLDDIGAENVTPWSRDEVLGPILQYRMEEGLPTFFTSNMTIDELESHLSSTKENVDKIKARRIIERIKVLTNEITIVTTNKRS